MFLILKQNYMFSALKFFAFASAKFLVCVLGGFGGGFFGLIFKLRFLGRVKLRLLLVFWLRLLLACVGGCFHLKFLDTSCSAANKTATTT
jgi:hypothetical protein